MAVVRAVPFVLWLALLWVLEAYGWLVVLVAIWIVGLLWRRRNPRRESGTG